MITRPPRLAATTVLSIGVLVVLGLMAASLQGAKKKERPAPAVERPAIPQEGETFTVPIPATRLGNDGLPELVSGEAAATQPESTPAPAPEVMDWTLAGKHVGKTITAEGKVVRTYSKNSTCFLNFADNREGFYVVIFEEAIPGFPEPPQKYLLHKTIRVTGKVHTHGGQPQIQVTDAKQIEVVPE